MGAEIEVMHLTSEGTRLRAIPGTRRGQEGSFPRAFGGIMFLPTA